MKNHGCPPQTREAGGALITSLLAAAALAAVAAAAFTMTLGQTREVATQGREMRAFYMAEAGLSETIRQVSVSVDQDQAVPASVGTANAPLTLKNGRFWSDVVDNGDDTFTITATGQVGTAQRTVRAVIAEVEGGVFDHAIFAGNSSGDPNYELRLSGTGTQADDVVGDIYSGNDIEVTEDATLTGGAYANGTVTGMAGKENVTRPIPDIAGMNYEVNNDFDVAALFAAEGVAAANPLGGTALELPEENPAHIFRLNPDDRLAEINGTVKDDYFLEDPYMPVTDFTAGFNGKDGHTITLSGTMSEPGVNGNERVYYIDGNLWVHNKPFGRLRFLNSDAAGVKVTFVVKGNVYFSDDVLLGDPANDGVAFIAIEDAAEPDSGNIYLGDPRYGTLERMRAFLYAENDFIDYNLSADGSSQVDLFGNMTAGNHVSIQRDYVNPDGSVEHSRLGVYFDDRLSTGALELPGLPGPLGGGVGGMRVVFWREVAE